MLSFGEANLGHAQVNGRTVPAQLTAAMKLAQKPIYQTENGLGHALSWAVANGEDGVVVFKDGGTAGFNSLILIEPGKDLAVFLVANRAESEATALGRRIARGIR